MSDKGLSNKAQENLRRNAELRRRKKTMHNKLLVLKDGEEVIRIFDPDLIEPNEIDYNGNGEKAQKFDYTVMNPNTGETETFRASIKTSGDIDALLAEGLRLIKIKREGSGKFDTRYYVTRARQA